MSFQFVLSENVFSELLLPELRVQHAKCGSHANVFRCIYCGMNLLIGLCLL